MPAEPKSLTAIVANIINACGDEQRINPTSIATAALEQLEPDNLAAGCHLALRQIARSMLRQRFQEEQDSDQGTLFPTSALQQRYPSARNQAGAECEYVQLEAMSPADFVFIVARLRKEGKTKSRHADALERFAIKKAAALESSQPE
jgi:hypothetical protein